MLMARKNGRCFYLSYCRGEALFGGGWFEREQDPPLGFRPNLRHTIRSTKHQLILRAHPYCSGMWNTKCELKVHCRCINYFHDIMVAIQVFPTCFGHSNSGEWKRTHSLLVPAHCSLHHPNTCYYVPWWWKDGHLGVPNQSYGRWTLFVC